MMDQATQFNWIMAVMAFLPGLFLGAILAAAWFFTRLGALERRNGELTAQIRAEKSALETAAAALDSRFKATAHEALSQSQQQFLALAHERLKSAQSDGAYDLEKRHKAIADLIEPVNRVLGMMDEKLKVLETARLTAYTELHTQLKAMTHDQLRLRQETASLVQALRSPATRGQWGEMQLRRCLEMAGLQAGVHFTEQFSYKGPEGATQRPDVIVHLPGGQCIVIDAKAPLEGYLEAMQEGLTEDARAAALDRHARHVKTHMRQLGAKSYWEQFDTPEFVVMFLPGESYFSAALERDPGLIEAGVNERVIPATPTTLISLLKAVMYGWRQEALAKNAQEISALGADLYKSIGAFAGHIEKVGTNLERAVGAYNDAVGSLERNVLPKARRFEDLKAVPQGEKLKVTADSLPVQAPVRRLNAQ